MRALVIKESQGLWTCETSSGVRSSGASLESALEKLILTSEKTHDWSDIADIFAGIRPSGGGQFVSGQASG